MGVARGAPEDPILKIQKVLSKREIGQREYNMQILLT